ncbi:alpha/beta fold hydrolase [Nocardia sp. NPDC004123]
MSTFVLIHGGSHGAWCWYKMVPVLESRGHTVVTPDLPGHGRDRTPAKGLTGAAYLDRVGSVLNSLADKAILVGHSMGGVTVKAAAERYADQIAGVAYVAADVVAGGQSLATDPALADILVTLGPHISADVDAETFDIAHEAATRYFYNDCDAIDIALALRLLTPEPTATITSRIDHTTDRYLALPRLGVITSADALLPADVQQTLYRRDGITDTVSLPTGHSPFLSAPGALAAHLLNFADRVG